MNFKKILSFLVHYKFFFLLLIVCLLAYSPSLIWAPKYDFADEFFPKRFFMFEAIQHHIFPIWSPYQNLGIPIHADPQYNAFYLPIWMFSFFGEYKTFFWGIEIIFHIFMGGLGFFFLARRFSQKETAHKTFFWGIEIIFHIKTAPFLVA